MAKSTKPKSYSDYTLQHLRDLCGVDNMKAPLRLFSATVEPSELLKQVLERNMVLPINTEKARSELLITPVLTEWLSRNPRKLQYFSGNTFDVDAERSLKGRCDYLFTKHLSMDIVAPVIAVFEAKDDNVDNWYAQCGAEMFAARLFNERNNEPYRIIHGAVTDGFEWVFLRLEESLLTIDAERFYLRNLPELLGALETVMNFYQD